MVMQIFQALARLPQKDTAQMSEMNSPPPLMESGGTMNENRVATYVRKLMLQDLTISPPRHMPILNEVYLLPLKSYRKSFLSLPPCSCSKDLPSA